MIEIPEPIRIRTLEELLERISTEPLTDEISRNERDYFNVLKNMQRLNYKGYLIYAYKYMEMMNAKIASNSANYLD